MVQQRKSAIFRRWLSLTSLTIVSASLMSLALVRPSLVFEPLLNLPLWALASLAAIFLIGCARVEADRQLAFWGLRHPWTYPPVWFAGFWATGLLLLALGQFSVLREEVPQAVDWVPALRRVGGTHMALPLLIAVGSSILRRQPTTDPKPSDNLRRQPLGIFDDLLAWIPDDRPLLNSSDDCFGHRSIAHRIAQRLARGAASHAVLGDLGAGKTSLRHLVSGMLESFEGGHRVRIVAVELRTLRWKAPFARSSSLSQRR